MTELSDFQNKIAAFLPEMTVLFNEPMARHTSFRIGGPAEVMVFPKNQDQLARILKVSALMDITPAILGAGTNILAPDEGLPGLVICLKDALDGMEQLDGNRIRVCAGVTMARAAVFAAGLGLSGMECLHGIPGSVGGGVFMNAGAYGGEVCDVLETAQVMDRQGNIRCLTCRDMDLGYRRSSIQTGDQIVVSAIFQLTPGKKEDIQARMKELIGKRTASQPLDLPSAGSAFKRPQGGYAAALIEQAGLKGFRMGNAAISAKHAGFAVNLGGATAEEMRKLLQYVSDAVFEQTGIRLEPEVRIW